MFDPALEAVAGDDESLPASVERRLRGGKLDTRSCVRVALVRDGRSATRSTRDLIAGTVKTLKRSSVPLEPFACDLLDAR